MLRLAAILFSIIATTLAPRSLGGSTRCCPPHAIRPNGKPNARSSWKTMPAPSVAETNTESH